MNFSRPRAYGLRGTGVWKSVTLFGWLNGESASIPRLLPRRWPFSRNCRLSWTRRPIFAPAAETLALARQHMLSVYDAAYLELGLRRGAALASLDQPLREVAKK